MLIFQGVIKAFIRAFFAWCLSLVLVLAIGSQLLRGAHALTPNAPCQRPKQVWIVKTTDEIDSLWMSSFRACARAEELGRAGTRPFVLTSPANIIGWSPVVWDCAPRTVPTTPVEQTPAKLRDP